MATLGLAYFLLHSSYYSTDNLGIFFSFALRIDEDDEINTELGEDGRQKS